ncbi:MAG: hypothetical protein KF911_12745 [Pseudomonadales bacterium]|nr:hypothetical protein [Pseudomonadales bacterium]
MNVLPWQEATAGRLAAQLAAGRLPHALLVSGPAGWGEAAFANWLALHLLGLDEALAAEGLAHPDLRWIVPDGSLIKVDAVRELAEFAQGTAQNGPRKVAVLIDAHAMNRNAANALLKTLEEPPAGTHLILVSCRPGRLLPTLRSRCQQITLTADRSAARGWLAGLGDVPDLELREFEHGGAPVAIAAGLAADETPLAALLDRALAVPDPTTLADAVLKQDLTGVTGRWLRYVAAGLAGESRIPRLAAADPRGLARFAAELVWIRGQLLASNSVNVRLMGERLLVLWRALIVS